MRSFSHWTPAYIYNRLSDWVYRSSNPQAPWLTPRAIEHLEKILQPEFIGLEYGSGRSTTWFARQIKHLVSVEHNPEWFSRVQSDMKTLGITNIDYHLFPKPQNNAELASTIESSYVQATGKIEKNSLDFVLVDGVSRPACLLHSILLLKTGGYLILDDANHYLPSNSKAPNSRSVQNGPLDEEWKKVESELANWDSVWFGNGIKETVIFKKP